MRRGQSVALNRDTSLRLVLGIAVTLMSTEIGEHTAGFKSVAGQRRGSFRGRLGRGGNGRGGKRRKVGTEQESTLLKCQRRVRSASDAPSLQAPKHQTQHTAEDAAAQLRGRFLPFFLL